MNIYSLFCILCQFYQSTSIKIKPELKKNILNFGYGINYKYEGMLVHSFERFHVVTKIHITHNRRFKIFQIKLQ